MKLLMRLVGVQSIGFHGKRVFRLVVRFNKVSTRYEGSSDGWLKEGK